MKPKGIPTFTMNAGIPFCIEKPTLAGRMGIQIIIVPQLLLIDFAIRNFCCSWCRTIDGYCSISRNRNIKRSSFYNASYARQLNRANTRILHTGSETSCCLNRIYLYIVTCISITVQYCYRSFCICSSKVSSISSLSCLLQLCCENWDANSD